MLHNRDKLRRPAAEKPCKSSERSPEGWYRKNCQEEVPHILKTSDNFYLLKTDISTESGEEGMMSVAGGSCQKERRRFS